MNTDKPQSPLNEPKIRALIERLKAQPVVPVESMLDITSALRYIRNPHLFGTYTCSHRMEF